MARVDFLRQTIILFSYRITSMPKPVPGQPQGDLYPTWGGGSHFGACPIIVNIEGLPHWNRRAHHGRSPGPAPRAAWPDGYIERPAAAVRRLRSLRRRPGLGTICGVGFPKSFRVPDGKLEHLFLYRPSPPLPGLFRPKRCSSSIDPDARRSGSERRRRTSTSRTT